MDLSIVIPIYNEEENIRRLHEEMTQALRQQPYSYEIVYINDSSTDRSLEILKDLFTGDAHVQVVSLLGNHGQSGALSAGFNAAAGRIIVAMDGDGQHDPCYIPAFVQTIEQGHDVVSGWKEDDRSRSVARRIVSQVAHILIRCISGVNMRYFGATMKAYRREVLNNLNFFYGDLHRFAGVLIYYKGMRIKELPIRIRHRESGKTHYKMIGKSFKVALDLILIKFLIHYAKRPFRVFGLAGTLLACIGTIGFISVFILKYFYGASMTQNVSILTISSLLLIIGIQFLFFGLMAEMISRIYYTANKNELYSIKEHLRHEREPV